jgi:hypothetical protein
VLWLPSEKMLVLICSSLGMVVFLVQWTVVRLADNVQSIDWAMNGSESTGEDEKFD